MSGRRISLRIDRITVSGCRPSRARLAAAVEAELARLLAEPGAADRLRPAGATDRLTARTLAPGSADEAALGQAVARATLSALGRDGSTGGEPR